GVELRGKTLGIVGIGKIGQEVAKIALGCGMNVIACDPFVKNVSIRVALFNGQYFDVEINTIPLNEVLTQSDFVTLHIPKQDKYIIGKTELDKMKKGAGLINASRGGLVDEEALLEALDREQLSFAALDTFVNEPAPVIRVLMHPKVSLSPHIGASTLEAQDRIGLELAEQIVTLTKK
ncbi:MAG TPA: NAD(P)-dependent oxidoreductase, partial [Flavobacteriaceae bacterium]|nr:NAD(P)-dependent oxidoreductase [Flavobacteriaceae bacterium]